MERRNNYKNFNDFKNQNYYDLICEYNSGKNCSDSMRSTDDCGFDDFCTGEWQRLDYNQLKYEIK